MLSLSQSLLPVMISELSFAKAPSQTVTAVLLIGQDPASSGVAWQHVTRWCLWAFICNDLTTL